jgi:hypothetical protein
VPENLRDKPTLVVSLINPVAGEQNLELSYLTGGLSWRADYVAELNEHDHYLDFNGWVTLTNNSGAATSPVRSSAVSRKHRRCLIFAARTTLLPMSK